MNILLLGLGKSNRACLKYISDNDSIFIFDEKDSTTLSYDYLKEHLPLFDICIRSPGISMSSEIYKLARILSKKIVSEFEFVSSRIKNKHLIVVTGTNGKTTVCEMLYHVLKNFYPSHLVGNIGYPLADEIEKINEDDIVILEASSFQLEDTISLKPEIVVITNLAPNHLNASYSLESYYAAKKRILFNQSNLKLLLINEECTKYFEGYSYQTFNENQIIDESCKKLFQESFNRAHCEVIHKICEFYKIDKEECTKMMKTYHLSPYRNQVIIRHGIKIINDSKSTNLSSTNACLDCHKDEKRIIILGGINKSESFKNLHRKEDDIILTFGKDGKSISESINGIYFNSLKELFDYIKKIYKGEVVIFSPGCSSFDQFDSYCQRGDYFTHLIDLW